MSRSKDRQWTSLDNAAKIFPPTSKKRDTRVFRFACELTEPVDPALLLQALEQTVVLFPSFRSVLKKGLFWYYLEQSDLPLTVGPEQNPPCSSIYDQTRRLLFEVTYYHCRINLEVYHALSDGTGALQFLRQLVLEYLFLRYPDVWNGHKPTLDYDASNNQRLDDSFQQYASDEKHSFRSKDPAAYQLRGPKLPEYRISVIEGVTSTSQLLAKAKQHGATVTVFLCAVLMDAISQEIPTRDRHLPVCLTVPVNLRQYFYSESVRNFFSVINTHYQFSQPHTLQQIIDSVSKEFKQKLTVENLQGQMDAYSQLERNPLLRVVPLAIKDPVMNWIYKMTAKHFTAAISNIGRIEMPEAFAPYIRLFDVFVSTDGLQLCLCSYRDRMTLSFTTPFDSTDIPKRFFRTLTQMGLPVTVSTNLEDFAEPDRPAVR